MHRTTRLGRITLAAVACVALASCAQPRATDYDLLIRNASVVDGTGASAYRANVLVKGDTIAAIDTQMRADATAARVIDAERPHAGAGLHRHARARRPDRAVVREFPRDGGHDRRARAGRRQRRARGSAGRAAVCAVGRCRRGGRRAGQRRSALGSRLDPASRADSRFRAPFECRANRPDASGAACGPAGGYLRHVHRAGVRAGHLFGAGGGSCARAGSRRGGRRRDEPHALRERRDDQSVDRRARGAGRVRARAHLAPESGLRQRSRARPAVARGDRQQAQGRNRSHGGRVSLQRGLHGHRDPVSGVGAAADGLQEHRCATACRACGVSRTTHDEARRSGGDAVRQSSRTPGRRWRKPLAARGNPTSIS